MKKGPEKRLRALLLYMAGDNDLSDAGLRDVKELCDVGSSPDVHVGVEIDTKGDYSGSIRYEITEKADWDRTAYRTVIERLGEKDSGKPITLIDFIIWGLRRYPAKETVVVIGGHGDGFRSRERAIAIDESGSSLDMPEVDYVFERSFRAVFGDGYQKQLSRKKFGILGFDACLMGMLEIAHHFQDWAKILVGSQAVEPGEGWPYDKVLVQLKDTSRTLNEIAAEITESYARQYIQQGVTNVTQAAIDLSKTGAAMARLSTLGEILAEKVEDVACCRNIEKIRRTTQSFSGAEHVDMIHFAENLEDFPDPGVNRAARDLITTSQKCIIKNRSLGREVANANGLSIWFPVTMFSHAVNRSRYLNLKGTSEYGGWIKFLDAYFANNRNS